jgi:hypothetical protein
VAAPGTQLEPDLSSWRGLGACEQTAESSVVCSEAVGVLRPESCTYSAGVLLRIAGRGGIGLGKEEQYGGHAHCGGASVL